MLDDPAAAMKEEIIYHIYVRASLRGNKSRPDFDFPLGTSIFDLQDADIADANVFFDILFKHAGSAEWIEHELLFAEIITVPDRGHKMFAGLTDIPKSMYEPEWLQNNHVFYFRDWKVIGPSEPRMDIMDIANVIENHSVKGMRGYYMAATQTGWEKYMSIAAIRKANANNLSNLDIYSYSMFLQILSLTYYDKEQDAFYSIPFTTLRKLTFDQKFRVLKYSRVLVSAIDSIAHGYATPAALLYGVVPAVQQLLRLYRGEISLWEIQNVDVKVTLKLKLLLVFLSTLFYAYVGHLIFK